MDVERRIALVRPGASMAGVATLRTRRAMIRQIGEPVHLDPLDLAREGNTICLHVAGEAEAAILGGITQSICESVPEPGPLVADELAVRARTVAPLTSVDVVTVVAR